MLGITSCQLVLDPALSAVSHSVILLAGKNKLSSLPKGALSGYQPDPRVIASPLLFHLLACSPLPFAMIYGYTLWHAP